MYSKRVIKAYQTFFIEEDPPGPPPDPPEISGPPDELSQPAEPEEPGPSPEETRAACETLLAEARKEASFLLEEARGEARQIVGGAQADAVTLREEARREGREQGLAEGRGQGLAEGREQGVEEVGRELRELLQNGQKEVDDVLARAEAVREKQLDEMEPKIYRLALQIAGKILAYELDHNEEAYMSILSQAMSSIRTETKVTLRVNASEYLRYFHSRETARIRTENGPVTVGVVIDASVEPGGCLLETETGMIDISAGAQIEQIAYNLGLEQ